MNQLIEPSAPPQVVSVVDAATTTRRQMTIQAPIRGQMVMDNEAIKLAYNRAATILGAAHIFCGIITFCCGVDVWDQIPEMMVGILPSMFFFISGGLAIKGALSGKKCLVVATLVMAIISAICAGILLITSSFCLALSRKTSNTPFILLIAMGLTMLIVAIVSAALTCRPLCCLQPNHYDHYQPGNLHFSQPNYVGNQPNDVSIQPNEVNQVTTN